MNLFELTHTRTCAGGGTKTATKKLQDWRTM